MNRQELARRTALAAKIHDRHNPPYRIINTLNGEMLYACQSREDARATRRKIYSVPTWIERRTADGTYTRIR